MVKNTLPVTFLVIFIGLTAGLSFDVDVAEVTDYSFKDFQYDEEVETVHELKGNVENVGSIGCSYRLKAEYSQGDETFERYSSAEPLWQGSHADLSIHYIPMNYTGVVDGDLFIQYCDQEKHLEEFSFNVTENSLPGAGLESRTVSASENRAKVQLDNGDLLVPEEEPSFWRTSSAPIENGYAKLQYEAPIFSESESITYTVVEDGSIAGSVEVRMEAEPNFPEKLVEHKTDILFIALLLSLLVNIGYLVERRGLHKGIAEKIKSLK